METTPQNREALTATAKASPAHQTAAEVSSANDCAVNSKKAPIAATTEAHVGNLATTTVVQNGHAVNGGIADPAQNNGAAEVEPSPTPAQVNESLSVYTSDGRAVVKNLAWLKAQPRFLCWSLIPQENGSVKKIPYNPATGWSAESDNPATWVDFETAKAAVLAGQYDSIGIALGRDLGLVIVDFDKVIPKPGDRWPEWVKDIVEDLNSYTEVSASGRGMHVLAWGEIPSNLNRKGQQIEIHDSKKMFAISTNIFEERDQIYDRSKKLLALHGRILEGTVGPDHKALIVSRDSQKYLDIVAGDYAKHGLGRSEAVHSAVCTLAWKHDGDKEAMRRVRGHRALRGMGLEVGPPGGDRARQGDCLLGPEAGGREKAGEAYG